ncbi:MAG: FtsX-like permease family protein [Phycisphaerae bacterium]|nr:FtsX-like permease family protein [Phycisphaerae bacterium]
MFYLRIILAAIRALRTNLLRSLLATLGVIIGVAAVVAAMSILKGATKEILETASSFGSNVLIVFPGAARNGGRATGDVETLHIADSDAIVRQCNAVLRAAPEVLGAASVKYFSRNMACSVLGTTPEYSSIRNYTVRAGRFISRSDVQSEAYVVVLGHKVAEELFGRAEPVGMLVKIKGKPFTVVGVMEKKGTLGFTRVDEQVVVPLSTAMKRLFGYRSVHSISVQTRSTDLTEEGRGQVTKLLRKRHKIKPGEKADFGLFSQEQLLEGVKDYADILGIVFYSIAGISMVVGGIGIMNIMLVSVTERTREIGVRMAVGAKRTDILSQFLAESSSISLIGGAIGVLLGIGLGKAIEDLSRGLFSPYTPSTVITTALSVAIITGIVSGIYPAYKASRLDPVEALRYE